MLTMPPNAKTALNAYAQVALVTLGAFMLAGAFIWMVLEPEHSVWGLFYLNFAVIDFYLALKGVKD